MPDDLHTLNAAQGLCDGAYGRSLRRHSYSHRREATMKDAPIPIKNAPAWLMSFFTGFSGVIIIGVLVYAILRA